MYRNRDTGIWEEDFRRKGVARLHVSYGVTKKDDARRASEAMHRIFREKRLELIEKVRHGAVSPHELAALIADEKPLSSAGATLAAAQQWPTVPEAVADYIDYLKTSERKSGGTPDTAAVQLARFVKFIGAERRANDVTAEHVEDYQRTLFAEGKAQNTVVGYVWRVSGLYTWLVKREKKNAKREARSPRALDVPIDPDEIANRTTHRDRWLTEKEAERLLAATPGPLLAAVTLGLLAGLRIGEVVHLRPRYDVDLKLGLLTLQEQPSGGDRTGWHPKNRKKRVVPIAPQLKPVLEHHLQRYASETWLFPSMVFEDAPLSPTTLWGHFSRIVEDAELVSGREDPRGVVFHTLRHTFASWLVMQGVDLYTVSQLLGNSLAIVERTYAHLAPDYRKRAVDRLAGIIAIPALEEVQ